MLEKNLSHAFTDSVKQKFMDLGFPSSTSGQLSKIIIPFKVDPVEKKVFSRCDNIFYLEQIIRPYQEELHDLVRKCWGANFVFEIDNNTKVDAQNIAKISEQNTTLPTQKTDSIPEDNSVFGHCTFKNFIPCESNEIALNLCKYISENHGLFSEPLFIYGQTGLGKTHLLHAIGNSIFQKNNRTRIVYVPMHDFINEVIHLGIKNGKMLEVRRKYLLSDVLLVDDIQILEKKSVCQVEFFHIIENLLQRKKQIIFTSSKSPSVLQHMDDRLKGRFLQGAIVEVNAPTLNDRIALVKEKIRLLNITLSNELIILLSSQLKTNVRELDGALHDILFKYPNLKKSGLSKSHVMNIIQQRLPTQTLNAVCDIDSLQNTVCKYFNIEMSALKGKQRHKNFVLARHLAIYMAKELCTLNSREIARAFDRKHHKIVLYATRKITDLLVIDQEIMTHVANLRKKI